MLLLMRFSAMRFGKLYCFGRVPEKACPCRSRNSSFSICDAAERTSWIAPACGTWGS